jgi:hypothetical protein
MLETKQIALNSEPESLEEVEEQSKAIMDVAITSLYGEPALSSVREILSNALDANRETEAEQPVEISYSSEKESVKIRDFGSGLNPEKMDKLYGRLFSSSKRDNPNQIGRFGVGRLSVLSHTKRFFLYTFVNGVKYKYKVFLDSEKGLPSYRLVEEEETEEPNGTSVFIPEITSGNHKVWNFLVKQGSYAPNRIAFKDGMEKVKKAVEDELSEVLAEQNGWRIYSNTRKGAHKRVRLGISFYIDGVFYSLSARFMSDVRKEYKFKCKFTSPLSFKSNIEHDDQNGIVDVPREAIALFLSSEEIKLSSSREQIKEDEKNKEAIAEILSQFNFSFAEWVTLDRSDEDTVSIAEKLPLNLRNYALAMQGFSYKGVPIGETVNLKEAFETDNFSIPWEIIINYRENAVTKISTNEKNVSITLFTYAFQASLNSSRFDAREVPKHLTGRIPCKDGTQVNLAMSDYLKHKFVVVNSGGGISPEDFLKKHGYNVTNPNSSFFIIRADCSDTTIDPQKVVPLLAKLADNNILDVDFIAPDKKNKKSSSKDQSINSIGKPETKKFRREIRKLLPKEAVDKSKLNINNVVGRAFGNSNPDGTVNLECLPTEIFYTTTHDPKEVRHILRNNSVKDDDPIYYVKSNEHIEALKSLGFLPRPFNEFPIKRYKETIEKLCRDVPSEHKGLAKALITSLSIDSCVEGKMISTKSPGTIVNSDIRGNELMAFSLVRESIPVGKEIAESIGELYPKEMVKIFCENINSLREIENESVISVFSSRGGENESSLKSAVKLARPYDVSLASLSEKEGLRSLGIYNTYYPPNSIKSQAMEILKKVFSQRVLLYLSPFLDFLVSLPNELPERNVKERRLEIFDRKELWNIDKLFPLYKWLNLERL